MLIFTIFKTSITKPYLTCWLHDQTMPTLANWQLWYKFFLEWTLTINFWTITTRTFINDDKCAALNIHHPWPHVQCMSMHFCWLWECAVFNHSHNRREECIYFNINTIYKWIAWNIIYKNMIVFSARYYNKKHVDLQTEPNS
jgi:hypothetical protein